MSVCLGGVCSRRTVFARDTRAEGSLTCSKCESEAFCMRNSVSLRVQPLRRSMTAIRRGPLVEAEFIALDVLRHEARFVFLIGR